MKYRPILFSAEMIRALLREENPKTQTRRIVKLRGHDGLQDSHADWRFCEFHSYDDKALWQHKTDIKRCITELCPYGVLGDRLWVRESTVVHASIREQLVGYVADGCKATEHWEKTMPSIHMRKAHCRIVLEITDVRVERLNSISETDAKAEGVEPARTWVAEFGVGPYSASYSTLWEKINGPGSWSKDDWVWALTFKRV